MARKKLAWAELRVGILVIASFTILIIALLAISGGAGFFTPRYLLKTYFPSADGLRKGSLVWIAGIEGGNVVTVNITPSSDPNRAVEVVMQIQKQFEPMIREDSVAALGSIGLLGDKYIDISRGSANFKPLPPNGEVKGSSTADIRRIMQNSNDLVANLGDLVSKINQITQKIDQGQGTIGKFINDPALYNNVNSTVSEAQHLLQEIKSGEGTIAFDRPIPWLGRWVRDVRIAFDGGRLTKFSASENEDFIRADWEEAKGPKDLLGYLDVGLNPKARSGFLQDAIVAGNVYVAVGSNDEVPGGKNKTDFFLGASLTGATVTIDERPVIRNGKLAA